MKGINNNAQAPKACRKSILELDLDVNAEVEWLEEGVYECELKASDEAFKKRFGMALIMYFVYCTDASLQAPMQDLEDTLGLPYRLLTGFYDIAKYNGLLYDERTDDEKRQIYANTLKMQAGFIYSSNKEMLKYWLKGYSQPVHMQRMLDRGEESAYSASFAKGFMLMRRFRDGHLSKRQFLREIGSLPIYANNPTLNLDELASYIEGNVESEQIGAKDIGQVFTLKNIYYEKGQLYFAFEVDYKGLSLARYEVYYTELDTKEDALDDSLREKYVSLEVVQRELHAGGLVSDEDDEMAHENSDEHELYEEQSGRYIATIYRASEEEDYALSTTAQNRGLIRDDTICVPTMASAIKLALYDEFGYLEYEEYVPLARDKVLLFSENGSRQSVGHELNTHLSYTMILPSGYVTSYNKNGQRRVFEDTATLVPEIRDPKRHSDATLCNVYLEGDARLHAPLFTLRFGNKRQEEFIKDIRLELNIFRDESELAFSRDEPYELVLGPFPASALDAMESDPKNNAGASSMIKAWLCDDGRGALRDLAHLCARVSGKDIDKLGECYLALSMSLEPYMLRYKTHSIYFSLNGIDYALRRTLEIPPPSMSGKEPYDAAYLIYALSGHNLLASNKHIYKDLLYTGSSMARQEFYMFINTPYREKRQARIVSRYRDYGSIRLNAPFTLPRANAMELDGYGERLYLSVDKKSTSADSIAGALVPLGRYTKSKKYFISLLGKTPSIDFRALLADIDYAKLDKLFVLTLINDETGIAATLYPVASISKRGKFVQLGQIQAGVLSLLVQRGLSGRYKILDSIINERVVCELSKRTLEGKVAGHSLYLWLLVANYGFLSRENARILFGMVQGVKSRRLLEFLCDDIMTLDISKIKGASAPMTLKYAIGTSILRAVSECIYVDKELALWMMQSDIRDVLLDEPVLLMRMLRVLKGREKEQLLGLIDERLSLPKYADGHNDILDSLASIIASALASLPRRESMVGKVKKSIPYGDIDVNKLGYLGLIARMARGGKL